MARGEIPLDWSAGENLAYATLLRAGTHVRLTGQDTERGTFGHRNAVLARREDRATYVPLEDLGPGAARFEVYNSPLSETGCMGFEFGYSLDYPDALVLWEAQFGDFANGAQVIIDQFIVAAEDKWRRLSGLTLLLPHGYEGAGPGALQRAAGALPGDVRRGQHPGLLPRARARRSSTSPPAGESGRGASRWW
jgi:2-oxoglutarate dehydrogenase E1 component